MKRINYDSPVGLLEIGGTDAYITYVKLIPEENRREEQPNELLKEARKQLEEYFAGSRKQFDLPLQISGSAFQKQAWEYLQTIPYGETVSYKEEATALGNPKACRAVGSANGRNNIAIIIPCHRVINADKKLGGYAYGLDVKKKLLQLEKASKGII